MERSAPTVLLLLPVLPSFRRTLEGAFVVSRSDLPFFVGVRGNLGVALACGRRTLGAASPMKPKGSFSFACSYVILPDFSLVPEGEGDRCAGLRAMAVQVRETLAKVSRCSPMQDWKRELNGGTMKDFILKTDERRGNLSLCFA